MKRKFTFLIAAIALMAFLIPSKGWGQMRTDFEFNLNQLYQSGTLVTAKTVITESGGTLTFTDADENFTVLMTRNSGNQPGFYTSSGYIRFYSNDTFKLSAADGITMTKIVITPNGTSFSLSTMTGLNTSTKTWEGSATEVTFTGAGTNKWDKLTITYTTAGSTTIPTTVTIDATGITNNDVYVGTAAGTLTATVKDNNNTAISGATVAWTSSNESVATIDSDGEVTLVAAGTTTITASYAGNATYTSSSATYDLVVVDNTPFTGGDVTFYANVDLGNTAAGAGSITKKSVTFGCSNGILGNGTEYRLYKNSNVTFTTTYGFITKIEFTCKSSYPATGFATQTGLSFNGDNGTWIGSETSVTFVASNKQVQATEIVVTVSSTSVPSITAANVDIAYDATNGSIAYTIHNEPTPVGTLSASTTDTWLTLGTPASGTVSFNCDANPAGTARTATVTLTYTYDTDQTVTKNVTITQAGDPNYTMTIAEVRALTQGTTVATKGVVTSISGGTNKTAYLQDATAGIVAYGPFTTTVAVGDEIRVEGELTAYQGLLEIGKAAAAPTITVLSSGNTVTPAVKTIDQLTNDIQAQLVKVENATVTAIDGTNTTIAQGANTIVVRGITETIAVNDIITLTANVGCYSNNPQLVNPTNVEITPAPAAASITVTPTTVDVPVEGGNGTLTVTYDNITTIVSEVLFYEADGTTAATYSWIIADINAANNVEYVVENNTGDVRTAYLKVHALDDDANDVYSDLVTITQAANAPVITTGTIVFGNNGTKINAASVTGDDSMGHTWTITTEGTTSFTPNTEYSQIGSNSNPASKITFSMTLSEEVTFTSVSAKFVGSSGSSHASIQLKIGDDAVAYGEYTGANQAIVSSPNIAAGTSLTITILDITGGVRCFYINYTIDATTDPLINAPSVVDLSSLATSGEIEYSIFRPVSGNNLTATSTAEWISGINVTANKVTFNVTQNTNTTDDRTGAITLSYPGAADKVVTINQSKVDYATLPFTFTDGKNAIETTVGLTQNGLGSDYSSNANLKFDSEGDWIVLHLNEAPTSLSYDIQGNGFSSGVFTVVASADGINYSYDLMIFTNLGSTLQTITHVDLASDIRYIKWIFNDKGTGNVGVGNIRATGNYDIYGKCTVASLAIGSKTCTVYSGGLLDATTISGASVDKLIIQDGGQVKCNNSFSGTMKKNIIGYGAGNEDGRANYYLMGAPVQIPVGAMLVPGGDSNFDKSDVYWFDGRYEKAEWRWAEGGGPTLVGINHHGFLFAYRDDCELALWSSTGPFPATNATIDATDLTNIDSKVFGKWNLIGNPFTCNAYLAGNRPFYRMNAAGDAIVLASNSNGGNVIKPLEGVFILFGDTETATSVTFQTTDPTETSAGNNSSTLEISVSQAQGTRGEAVAIDAVRICFGEGQSLAKFNFMGNNNGLCIPQNGKDYAVVCSEAHGEMPVNFKAAKTGTYTLSVEAENIDVDYLHLIDNITGMDVDLLQTPSYTFEGKKSDYTGRFRLVFSANNANENDDFAFISNGQIILNNTDADATVQIIDALGRMIASANANNRVSTDNMAPGVYVLRLINGNDVKTQKIVVK